MCIVHVFNIFTFIKFANLATYLYINRRRIPPRHYPSYIPVLHVIGVRGGFLLVTILLSLITVVGVGVIISAIAID